jgi:hypothetical protein
MLLLRAGQNDLVQVYKSTIYCTTAAGCNGVRFDLVEPCIRVVYHGKPTGKFGPGPMDQH